MILSVSTRRRFVLLFVCALALGVLGLATLAKFSQYGHGTTIDGYFAKSVKMSGERCQVGAAIVPSPKPPVIAPPVPVIRVPDEPFEPALPQAVFLDSFRFRPPPVASV